MSAAHSLSPEERAIVDAAARIWNDFLDLPIEHPCDRQEFCAAVHAVQALVLMRPGRRAYNADAAP